MNIVPYLWFNGTCAEAFRFYETALGGKIGDTGRDHAAVRMADQDRVTHVFHLQDNQHVLHVRLETDQRCRKMHAVAKTRVGRRDQLMALRAHQRVHCRPHPARRPGTMRDDESGHAFSFISPFETRTAGSLLGVRTWFAAAS